MDENLKQEVTEHVQALVKQHSMEINDWGSNFLKVVRGEMVSAIDSAAAVQKPSHLDRISYLVAHNILAGVSFYVAILVLKLQGIL